MENCLGKNQIVCLFNHRGHLAERNPYRYAFAGPKADQLKTSIERRNKIRQRVCGIAGIIGVLAFVAILVALYLLVTGITVAKADSDVYYQEEEEEENWIAEVTGELLYDYPEYDSATVESIQRALNRYLSKHLDGFVELEVDGQFGPATATAVKDYQRLHGFSQKSIDGIVGKTTAKNMNVKIEENLRYAPSLAEKFRLSKNGIAAHLCLNSHLLEVYYHYETGWELVKIMKCSTGNQKKGKYTPVGVYILDGTTHDQITGDYDDDGIDDWAADDATKICRIKDKGTFLFHSVLRHPDGKGGWTYDEDSTLGKSITGGCVRLSRDNAAWVRKHLTKGTVVVIDDRSWDNTNILTAGNMH